MTARGASATHRVRIALRAVTLALVALVLSPLLFPVGWDDFPISSYPMFSRADLGDETSLSHAVLVSENGETRPAPPSVVGSPEVMVAKGLVERAIARGDADALCARIAERARRKGDAATAVEIVTSTFLLRRYFASREGRRPLRREVHARCPLP